MSYLSYFPRYFYFGVISKYEERGKYWSYCTWNHAITNVYWHLSMEFKKSVELSKGINIHKSPYFYINWVSFIKRFNCFSNNIRCGLYNIDNLCRYEAISMMKIRNNLFWVTKTGKKTSTQLNHCEWITSIFPKFS